MLKSDCLLYDTKLKWGLSLFIILHLYDFWFIIKPSKSAKVGKNILYHIIGT